MKTFFYPALLCPLPISCARIPIEAVKPAATLKTEASLMHYINISFPNKIAMPMINSTRDSLTNVIDETGNKVIDKLNKDYAVFNEGFISPELLLESGNKLNKQTEEWKR